MFEEKLARARRGYQAKLQVALEQLARWVSLAREGADPRALQEAQRLAHKICGTAGTFGFENVSERLGWIDRRLLDVLSGQIEPTEELWRQVEQELSQTRPPELAETSSA